jgi:hypothetical protein
MSRYFARIVRALVVSSLGFGGGIGLLVCIITLVLKGDQNAFMYGLQAGTLFGLMFAVMLIGVLLPLDVSAHLFLSKSLHTEVWELEQSRQVTIEVPLREAMTICRRALLKVPYVKAVTEDPEKLTLSGSTGPSWRSSGEELSVKLQQLDGGKWQIMCSSKSPSTKIVFDYGKNFENVEAWMREVMALTAGSKQPA